MKISKEKKRLLDELEQELFERRVQKELEKHRWLNDRFSPRLGRKVCTPSMAACFVSSSSTPNGERYEKQNG